MNVQGGIPDVLAWVTDALGAAASLGDAPGHSSPGADVQEEVFREAVPLLRGVGDFDVLAFVPVEEDGVGFRPAVSDPPGRAADVDAEVRAQAAVGTFGWALYQGRPVVTAGGPLARWVVLHTVATPSRVLGMVVASRQGSGAFDTAISQRLLSIVLAQMARVLETRLLHRELAEYNARLELLVEERTRELRHSEAEARAAVRAKSEFLANMSHELRTPIHGILGFARLLEESKLDAEQREHVGIVQRSAQGLLSMVNDLLDLAKVEAGRVEVEGAPFDLLRALEDVVELASPGTAGKPVELVLDYGADVPRRFLGDVGRIRQVVLNLVANAVRFTDRGHVALRVRTGLDGGVTVAVEDTGVGIEPQRLESMFEKFTQGEGRSRGGTGLGLAIARNLARLMDGDVTATSRPGEGSVFTLSLPFLEESPEGVRSEGRLAGAEVVLVTSSRVLGQALGSALGRHGARVLRVRPEDVAARSAPQGGGSPCAVLVDGTAGVPALARLASEVGAAWQGSAPPLWALVDPEDRAEGPRLREAGYAGWLVRPLREARVLAVLGAVAEAVAVRREARGPHFAGVRVLLADDDDISLRLGVHVLRRLGCVVTAVPDGRGALEAAVAGDFDLALLDGSMPGMDGDEVARELRRIAAWRTRPILSLSAGAAAADRTRALEAGMDDHLTKPLAPEALAAALARWLPRTPGKGAAFGDRGKPPEGPGVGAEALDVADALRRAGGSRSFVGSQVHLFLDAWPPLRRRMHEAWERGDTPLLRELAHRLKGSAAAVSAAHLQRVAAGLEAGSRGCAGDQEALAELDEAVEGVRAHLGALDGGGEAA